MGDGSMNEDKKYAAYIKIMKAVIEFGSKSREFGRNTIIENNPKSAFQNVCREVILGLDSLDNK